jgi:hypothetical protein
MVKSGGGFLRLGGGGCLLPFLIMFNLFFGRLFFHSTLLWLEVGGLLVLIFMLQIKLFASRVRRQFDSFSQDPAFQGYPKQDYKPSGKVIDIQGQEVNDTKKE